VETIMLFGVPSLADRVKFRKPFFSSHRNSLKTYFYDFDCSNKDYWWNQNFLFFSWKEKSSCF
jgi:hypothetical protein